MAVPGAAEIAVVRRRAAEPTPEAYDDAALVALIEAHAVAFDDEGAAVAWDLWAAAADVWAEKAAALAGAFDFSADGASFSRSQAHAQARRQAAFCASRSVAKGVAL